MLRDNTQYQKIFNFISRIGAPERLRHANTLVALGFFQVAVLTDSVSYVTCGGTTGRSCIEEAEQIAGRDILRLVVRACSHEKKDERYDQSWCAIHDHKV